MRLNEFTAQALRSMVVAGEISCREIIESVLHCIKERDGEIKAYVNVTGEEALKKADELDDKIRRGEEVGPLAGIPIAVKENICTEGIATTCCSKMLANFIPPYDASVIKRVKDAGAIIIGKTNMDEFAMGSSTETSCFFQTHNPLDTQRVPGGSSGGSAAAVAGHESILGLGSDTGGSIRQPSAFCGVVGLKPTYGRISRYGLIPFASSLDHVGTITKDLTDAALLLRIIAGYDEIDSTSVNMEVPDYVKGLKDDLQGLRIGVPKEYFVDGISSDVKEAVFKAIDSFEAMGARCEEVSLPHTEYAVATYYLIASAEASAALARYDGVRFGYCHEDAEDIVSMFSKTRGHGFGSEVKRRIMLGTYALSSENYDTHYLKAQKVRTLIRRDFDRVFENVDCLVSPVTPSVAFKLGEKLNDVLNMYLSDVCTIPLNLAAVPGISIPCALSNGLPVGLQIIGKHFQEEMLLRVAYAFEKNVDFREVNVGEGGRKV